MSERDRPVYSDEELGAIANKIRPRSMGDAQFKDFEYSFYKLHHTFQRFDNVFPIERPESRKVEAD